MNIEHAATVRGSGIGLLAAAVGFWIRPALDAIVGVEGSVVSMVAAAAIAGVLVYLYGEKAYRAALEKVRGDQP